MDIRLPQLAEGVESGTVVNILVSEGDKIAKDQAFMELETQKAVGSIPSPESGTVTKIHVKEGMEVTVGQVLISVSAEDAAAEAPPGQNKESQTEEPQRREAEPIAKPDSSPVARKAADSHAREPITNYRYESKSGVPPPAAPSIRKIVRELGIDLTRVKGSAAGGRIVLEDLRAFIQYLQQHAFQAQPVPAGTAPAPKVESIDFSKWGQVRREQLSSLRRTVSRRMVESWTTIPKINQFDEVDITNLLALRKKHVVRYQEKGVHLTVTSFLLSAVAAALKKHPLANASLDEATGDIVYKDYVHVGVAVDTEAGLIVPVLRDVDQKSLFDISRELGDLTRKTRERKISLEELQGGTFTISNQGSIGSSHFTPIIYAPQVAILGVGQSSAKPVVVKNKIAIRTLLPLCLSYDHRVLDGADAVRFLKEIISELESFTEADVKVK